MLGETSHQAHSLHHYACSHPNGKNLRKRIGPAIDEDVDDADSADASSEDADEEHTPQAGVHSLTETIMTTPSANNPSTPYSLHSYFGSQLPTEFQDSYGVAFFQPVETHFNNYQTTPCLSIGINALPISMAEHSIVQRKEAGNGAQSDYSPNSSSENSSRSNSAESKRLSPFYSMKTDLALTNGFTGFINRSPFETFCTVPGRTSLLSSTTKYKVTVGEIQRRISPPECLNASLLGGILRKAKSKDGGKALRESLKRIGLTLPAGRRKSTSVTAWTALVEEEAVHMARDFHSVCERDFPAKEMAVFLARNVLAEADAQRRRAMLHYVRMFIKEISDLINSDRSPICSARPEVILDPSIQKPLTHFSMVTHGFGNLAIVAVLDALNAYVHESFKYLDRTFGHATQNTFMLNPSHAHHLDLHQMTLQQQSQLRNMGASSQFSTIMK
uniref:Transcription factor AP-2 C-terminal domain-containing protein n=1 Tax=Acrobeloides nanus TaxID=290746 RepID=A0A914DRK1_9BILA